MTYEFGPFCFEAEERRLLKNGEEVKLTPREYQLLEIFLKNKDNLLTKEELMTSIWPDTFIEETRLTNLISTLRQKIGDEKGSRFIENVPKYGYRFKGEVREVAYDDASVKSDDRRAETQKPEVNPSSNEAISDRRSGSTFPNVLLVIAGAIAAIFAAVTFIARSKCGDAVLFIAAFFITLVVAVILFWLRDRIAQGHWFAPAAFLLVSVLAAIFSWALLKSVMVTVIQVAIIDPKDRADIGANRYVVKGTVSSPNARVYLVVRPVVPLDYWVQDLPTIAAGHWQVNAYLGQGNAGVGEDYELIALATEDNILVTYATGNLLSIGRVESVPTNTNLSNIVTVKRTR